MRLGVAVSLLLHLLLFYLLVTLNRHKLIVPPAMSPQSSTIHLDLTRFVPPPSLSSRTLPPPPKANVPLPPKPKTQTEPTKPTKPQPTPKPKATPPSKAKKPTKKKTSKTEPKPSPTKPKATRTKLVKKLVKRPKPKRPRTKITTYRPATTRTKPKGLAGSLLRHAKPIRRKRPFDSTDAMIKALYGKTFYRMSKTQRRFIRTHLNEIHRITQNTLVRNGYPEAAVRTHQQGVNVVTFYLHPNGDISGLRLIRPMGYEVLDQNTLEVIKIAYKDYPRPKETTKIIFRIGYHLY